MATTPYTVTLTDGTIFANISTGTVNQSSSMTLIGKNYAEYGQMLADNFIRLLENASNTTAPPAPLVGQLWWDKTTTLLKVYAGNGTWKNVGGATASSSQPSPSIVGDLWFNTVNQQLYVCSVAGSPGTFIVVGAAVNNSGNITLAVANSVIETVASTGVYVTGLITATGNITGSNIVTAGLATVTGNVTGGNVLTGGLISATGTVTGSSLLGSVVSASSNVTGGNVLTGGLISATGTVTGSSLLGSVVSASSNVTGGNVLTGGFVSAGGTITGSSLLGSVVSASSNVTGGNILTGGRVSAGGNITGSFFIGDGSQLTGIGSSSISNGTSNVRVVSSGGNIAIGVGGTSNVAVYATTGEYVTGVISANGNVTGGNVLTGGFVSAAGTVTGSSLLGTVMSVSGNVTGSQFIGSGAGLTSIPGGNVTSKVANASYSDSAGAATTAGSATTAGTVTNGTQANITSVGTLTSLSATGNITGGNVLAGATVTSVISTGGNILGGALTVVGNIVSLGVSTGIKTSGTVSAAGIVTGLSFTGAGTGLTGTAASLTAGSATTAGTVSNATQSNITGVGTLTSLSVTGNITAGNLNVSAGRANVSVLDYTGLSPRSAYSQVSAGIIDPNGPFYGQGGFRTGFWQFASYADDSLYFLYGQGFDTSIAKMFYENSSTSMTLGKVYATNGLVAGGTTGPATGNFTGGNLSVSGTVQTATISATGNISIDGNINGGGSTGSRISTGGNIVAAGRITGGNVQTGGNVTITGAGRLVAEGIYNTNYSFSSIALEGTTFFSGSTRIVVFSGTGGTVYMPNVSGGSATTALQEYCFINKCEETMQVRYGIGGGLIGRIPSGATGVITASAATVSSASDWALSVSTSYAGLGSGQTWQAVSRSLGTTYTNGAGRPIQVSIYFLGSSGSEFRVNGLTIASNSSQTGWMTVSEVIPPNATYQLVDINGGLTALNWYELR